MLVQIQGDLAASDAQLLGFLQSATAPITIHANQYTSQPFGFAADPAASGFDVGSLGRTIA
jgi:hypothetical protein